MTAREAAITLHQHLQNDTKVWSVGYTEGIFPEKLIVYRETSSTLIPTEWEGYAVEIHGCGRPIMLNAE